MTNQKSAIKSAQKFGSKNNTPSNQASKSLSTNNSTLKDSQRRTLALLILSIMGFFYVEKVLVPYLNGGKTSGGEISAAAGIKDAAKEVAVSGSGSGNASTGSNPNASAISTAHISGAQIGISNIETLREKGVIKVSTGVSQIEISKLGGRILSLKLDKFRNSGPLDPELYNMIFPASGVPLPAGITLDGQSDVGILYELEGGQAENDQAGLNQAAFDFTKDKPEGVISLVGQYPNGSKIRKDFTFKKDNYLFSLQASSEPSSIITIEWTKNVAGEHTGTLDAYDHKGFVWFDGEESFRKSFSEMTDKLATIEVPSLRWLGLGDKYFATAFISPASGSRATLNREANSASLTLTPLVPGPLEVLIFSGPKSYSLLEGVGFELRRLLDLGKTGLISAPLLSLLNTFYKVVGNYGLAIVLLTIMVKLLLYRLNSSQYKQMKALTALKPDMDRIKDTIKDKQQQQMAMMELYKNKGVNPLGGCLPVLVQMPIFIGLYSALMLSVELRHANYGIWVHDLASPDRLMIAGVGVPMLVVLFTISMMVQQWMTPSTMEPAQKKVMMFMPVMMFFMFMNFPAGLALYWLTNNLISIGQQKSIQYSDKSGKSGFKITALVAFAVFLLAYVCTLL